ncbi:MAG: hypothetical protein QOI12_274 [Alphaproteobacteria bacterium]|jgi:hypothetical protein|nr:hypothetical protein [Alphaproteobacteria bacterium]
MFSKIATALVIVLGVTSGAFAATAQQSGYGATSGTRAAVTQPRQHSRNPAWDVYDNSGHYVGSDPDPNVRMQMQNDFGSNE